MGFNWWVLLVVKRDYIHFAICWNRLRASSPRKHNDLGAFEFQSLLFFNVAKYDSTLGKTKYDSTLSVRVLDSTIKETKK